MTVNNSQCCHLSPTKLHLLYRVHSCDTIVCAARTAFSSKSCHQVCYDLYHTWSRTQNLGPRLGNTLEREPNLHPRPRSFEIVTWRFDSFVVRLQIFVVIVYPCLSKFPIPLVTSYHHEIKIVIPFLKQLLRVET